MELNELNLTDEQLASVSKYVQSETDKVRTDYSKKLKDVNDELAKYKPKEKSEAEKQIEERLLALEKREQELNAKERNNTIAKKFKEKGLPEELSSFISVGDDIDADVDKVVATLGGYFLNSNYKPSTHADNKGITKEQFKRMSYTERAKLFQTNPELYKALSK